MFIKKIKLTNFQVLKEFEADFSGGVYFIKGDNELGKSTLLKAILALLTGQRDNVLTKGEKKGSATMVVGDDGKEYEVSLSMTENNPRGTLTIKADGMSSSNISMLQQIFGYRDFDAVEFLRWSETAEGRRKQVAVVKGLLPSELVSELEATEAGISSAKAERTDVSRELKRMKAVVKDKTSKLPDDWQDGKYSKPIELTDLLEKQQKALALQERARTAEAALKQRTEQMLDVKAKLENLESEKSTREKLAKEEYEDALLKIQAAYENRMSLIKQGIEDERKRLQMIYAEAEERKENAEKFLAGYAAMHPEKWNFAETIASAQKHNELVGKITAAKAEIAMQEDIQQKENALNAKIAELDGKKEQLIKSAELPIGGLTFGEDGLLLNGIPFAAGQVSDSQMMEVAVRLIIAANKTVKVFRVARGESLGRERLNTILEIAKKHGYQGFIEEVKRGQDYLSVEEYSEDGSDSEK